MKYSKLALALAFSGTALFLTACNDSDNSSNNTVPAAPKVFVSEAAYDKDSMDEAKSIQVMNYKMPNVLGETIETSAIVLFPKTEQPKDGYRVVVWAHGTLGVADKCAPTNTNLGKNFKEYTAKNLLDAGYVVVAPNYEGFGNPKGGDDNDGHVHPYLNIKSEADSAIYAVKAAKEHYGKQLNGAWMSVGQSQGGQAALGVAQYADGDASYKGTVAGAPASSLGTIILDVAPPAIDGLEANPAYGKEGAAQTYATLLSYAALAGAGITAYEPTFDYRKMFQAGANAQKLAETAETECLSEMVGAYTKDILTYLAMNEGKKVTDYPGIDREAFEKNETVKDFLENKSQPTTDKLSKPILIVQGVYDTNVPYVVTNALYGEMRKSGTNVSLLPVSIAPSANNPVVNGSHTGAILAANEDGSLIRFVQQHMPAGK